MVESHKLDVPGARLHYDVRGSGPVLAIVGLPMTGDQFGALADELAGEYTVVTYDPRGFNRSTVEDDNQDCAIPLIAEDVYAVLQAVTDEPVIIFGSSGGAVTSLRLVETHPEAVKLLVAHEPPLPALLPNTDEIRATTQDVRATLFSAGPMEAFGKFMGLVGFEPPAFDPSGPPPPMPSEQEQRDGFRMLAHSLVPTNEYEPDLDALKAASTTIVVGRGDASTDSQMARQSADALAAELGGEAVDFPGGHGGFLPPGPFGGDPTAFAATLRRVVAAR